MLRKCPWCLEKRNGDLAIRDHAEKAHPKEYWTLKANNCRLQAQKELDWAARFEERAKAETPS